MKITLWTAQKDIIRQKQVGEKPSYHGYGNDIPIMEPYVWAKRGDSFFQVERDNGEIREILIPDILWEFIDYMRRNNHNSQSNVLVQMAGKNPLDLSLVNVIETSSHANHIRLGHVKKGDMPYQMTEIAVFRRITNGIYDIDAFGLSNETVRYLPDGEILFTDEQMKIDEEKNKPLTKS